MERGERLSKSRAVLEHFLAFVLVPLHVGKDVDVPEQSVDVLLPLLLLIVVVDVSDLHALALRLRLLSGLLGLALIDHRCRR